MEMVTTVVEQDTSTAGCLGQSIAQLYQAGKAFNFVTSRSFDPTGKTTIFTGWPDAIRCGAGPSGGGNPSGAIFFLVDRDPVAYAQVNGGDSRWVIFDGNGNYIKKGGDDDSSRGCMGQSITQLYQAGRAFNLVTSKTVDNSGTNSMLAGLPDAIQCVSGGYKGVFWLHGLGRYDQVYSPEIRAIDFEGNGKFLKSQGSYVASGDCKTKTLKELEADGRVYNFVTSRTQNTPPTCKDFSLTLKPADSGALNFAAIINDYEEGLNNLKIKIHALPTCTVITTTNGAIVN